MEDGTFESSLVHNRIPSDELDDKLSVSGLGVADTQDSAEDATTLIGEDLVAVVQHVAQTETVVAFTIVPVVGH